IYRAVDGRRGYQSTRRRTLVVEKTVTVGVYDQSHVLQRRVSNAIEVDMKVKSKRSDPIAAPYPLNPFNNLGRRVRCGGLQRTIVVTPQVEFTIPETVWIVYPHNSTLCIRMICATHLADARHLMVKACTVTSV